MEDTKAKELVPGKMDDAMRVNGAMAWHMARALRLIQMDRFDIPDNGLMMNRSANFVATIYTVNCEID